MSCRPLRARSVEHQPRRWRSTSVGDRASARSVRLPVAMTGGCDVHDLLHDGVLHLRPEPARGGRRRRRAARRRRRATPRSRPSYGPRADGPVPVERVRDRLSGVDSLTQRSASWSSASPGWFSSSSYCGHSSPNSGLDGRQRRRSTNTMPANTGRRAACVLTAGRSCRRTSAPTGPGTWTARESSRLRTSRARRPLLDGATACDVDRRAARW